MLLPLFLIDRYNFYRAKNEPDQQRCPAILLSMGWFYQYQETWQLLRGLTMQPPIKGLERIEGVGLLSYCPLLITYLNLVTCSERRGIDEFPILS